MRTALRIQAYVCLDCKLRQPWNYGQRYQSNLSQTQPVNLSENPPPVVHDISSETFVAAGPEFKSQLVKARIKGDSKNATSLDVPSNEDVQTASLSKTVTVSEDGEVALTLAERAHLIAVSRLRAKLEHGIQSAAAQEKGMTGMSFEDAVKAADLGDEGKVSRAVLRRMKTIYKGKPVLQVLSDTRKFKGPRRLQRELLRRIGLENGGSVPFLGQASKPFIGGGRRRGPVSSMRRERADTPDQLPRRALPRSSARFSESSYVSAPIMSTNEGRLPKRMLSKAHSSSSQLPYESVPVPRSEESGQNSACPSKELPRVIPKLEGANVRTISEADLQMQPLKMENPSVPGLSFDLSRVLFNPGIYQLQDPRSRVFNFSPYLQRILPVSEFNFDVLNEYITSSKDKSLIDLGRTYKKKYLGSSSSMTGALTHFHFLLSNWRLVNVSTLSQSFKDPLRTFTQFQRGPTAIFLRWKDGIYAVDADKEHDSANILMSLGKSMEKLLTLPEEEYERYRKTTQDEGVEPPKPKPEAYHYTESGDFLLRSQLDAYDARLPGTGMFDLKTRAVVSIRMNVRNPEHGLGYEIQNRFGDMESYEREYFDMIRSAFLKYSLQVRMGRMDGIFVAYHNIERIFGFQYVSLPEIDLHLHGTENPKIGDTEFKLSLRLLNEIFDRATDGMPQTSLRFHFETRDSKSVEGSFMYIFAEALSETDAENIQNSKSAEIAEFEARILNTHQPDDSSDSTVIEEKDPSEDSDCSDSDSHTVSVDDQLLDRQSEAAQQPRSAKIRAQVAGKSEGLLQPSEGRLMGFVLRTRSKVNGRLRIRPEQLHKSDSWDLEYTLEELPHERALHLYTQCRARRAKLEVATQREDAAADYYLRKMKQLAQQGKHLRKSIDKADAGRPVIVLNGVN